MIPNDSNRPHQGMPNFDQKGKPLSYFEFWPMWAFYPPVFLYTLWLMVRYRGVLIPTVANPSFPGGGFFGESKAEILNLAIKHIPDWVAPFISVSRPAKLKSDQDITEFCIHTIDELTSVGLELPVVAKPDLGCRGAGVKLIRTEFDLRKYIELFPGDATFLLQKYISYEGEAGIFYCRQPNEATGKIISITLKYFPYVYGDGISSLRELILRDSRAGRLSHLYLKRHTAKLDSVPANGEPVRLAFAGSHSKGAIFRNGTHLITQAMTRKFDEISRSIPEFYFGRYDIRFSDFRDVQCGLGFTILEANGAGAESTHIWDRQTSIFKAWGDLMKQYKLLFQIGRANIDRGFKPLSITEFKRWHRREKELTKLYPIAD